MFAISSHGALHWGKTRYYRETFLTKLNLTLLLGHPLSAKYIHLLVLRDCRCPPFQSHLSKFAHLPFRFYVQDNIQGVSKRALQLWKRIEIYTEDIHNVLNCQNVAKHTEFYLECSYHLCLQMSLNSELELLPQLQKWHQRCYVACGNRLTTGGTSAALPMEVTLNHNYPR